MLYQKDNKLIYHFDDQELWIEAWGEHGLRIRATKNADMSLKNWALEDKKGIPAITINELSGILSNGNIRAVISRRGQISIYNQKNERIIQEYWRNREDLQSENCSALNVEGREFKPNLGAQYHLTYRLESLDAQEKIYGMGQYQQPYLNLKGTDLELAQRNSQASVPFFISSLGYGMLWNNPAIGRAVFGKNIMTFEAYSTDVLDVWIVVGDNPAEIVERYANVTGKPPLMPDYGLGFWQCKLRYQTQQEVLEVAREYKKRNLPIDVIVIDFFHWKYQGEWSFDPDYWPDPDAMVKELEDMGIKLMVSIWPTVEEKSENYEEMLEKGYLIRTERGSRVGLAFEGSTIHIDVTNPDARAFLWDRVKRNYYSKGIQVFWLDEAEPEYSVYDFDNYRYYLGTDLAIGNCYPVFYAKAFFDGMKNEGQNNIVNLARCAWAGSQKYGALVWSGDIASSFTSMRNQLVAGLNMGLAGIPWWTTDIGGFHGGNPDDPAFRELFARWFAWGAFCPVMRLHGDREPHKEPMGESGGAHCCSGADNEVWSYGEEVYQICKKYMTIREELREYIRSVMKQAHEKGTPVMRPLFYMFPEDKSCWDIEDSYMFGEDYLVAPVFEQGVSKRKVYLPTQCNWRALETNLVYEGGQWIEVDAPLDVLPVFQIVR